MELTYKSFREVYDYEGWKHEISKSEWIGFLRASLIVERGGLSDFDSTPLRSMEMHEGIIYRNMVPKSVSWSHRIFSGINCFLLSPEQHRLFHTNDKKYRELSYHLSCERYGKDKVDTWLDSLPFKVKPEIPGRYE